MVINNLDRLAEIEKIRDKAKRAECYEDLEEACLMFADYCREKRKRNIKKYKQRWRRQD